MNAFQKIINEAVPVMAAVQSLFSYVIILSIVGYLIDEKLNTFPIVFITLLFVGLTIGFFQLYITQKKSSK